MSDFKQIQCCENCTQKDKSCPVYPSCSSTCIEFDPKYKPDNKVVDIFENTEPEKKFIPIDEVFPEAFNGNTPIKSHDSSQWHHMQCSGCSNWWAIEGALRMYRYFCPHCGLINLIKVPGVEEKE